MGPYVLGKLYISYVHLKKWEDNREHVFGGGWQKSNFAFDIHYTRKVSTGNEWGLKLWNENM